MAQNEGRTLPRVAYFCMEYGLHEELPLYAGGLGILAGDHIKSAGDRKLPLVAIGILWREGYTRQKIGADGYPYDEFPKISLEGLEDVGVRFHVQVQGNDVECRAVRCDRYGNAPLYLIEPVEERFRWITKRLYGGRHHERIAQELLLGVGGVRLLRALEQPVDVYHFNEGHAAFAGLELIRERTAMGESFDEAWAKTRDEIVFTTHTPVPAGNESHDHGVLREMGAYLDFGHDELTKLGGDPFNMTVAGLRLSRHANAVARLHGETSRKMWKHISGAAPIGSITNGVHPPSWQDQRIRAAFEARDPAALWSAHQAAKRELLEDVRARSGVELDPGRLVIGFARRAAAYKRSDLILRDPSRIEPMLERRDVQLIFSGKAHPMDEIGKRIVANLARLARQYEHSVVFLEDYDIAIGRALTRGCDVWLNNPVRPFEASGTSGMKAAMNGILNFSVLDGWWPEGCEHGVNGWQIGDAYEGDDRDEHDSRALHELLANEIVPTYYGDSERWIQMMQAAIEMSHWRFSSDRMVEEYYSELYSLEKRLRAVRAVS